MAEQSTNILRVAAFLLWIPLAGCIQSDSKRLAGILKISELPPSTIIEHCGAIDRDGPMWDCIIRTTPSDLQKIISGHEFSDLRMPPPRRVFLAAPKNFKQADHIHITYNEESGRAAIATHKP